MNRDTAPWIQDIPVQYQTELPEILSTAKAKEWSHRENALHSIFSQASLPSCCGDYIFFKITMIP